MVLARGRSGSDRWMEGSRTLTFKSLIDLDEMVMGF
jgi:hypothetical protein